jgi:hypothetical protein
MTPSFRKRLSEDQGSESEEHRLCFIHPAALYKKVSRERLRMYSQARQHAGTGRNATTEMLDRTENDEVMF